MTKDNQHICEWPGCKRQTLTRWNSTIKEPYCPTHTIIASQNKARQRENKESAGNRSNRSLNGKKSSIDKRLDRAWSKLVKLIANNRCEVCGNTKALNSHHLFSRAKKSLRWNVKNGVCLCVNHHIGVTFSAHKTPITFNDWVISNKGTDLVNELKYLSNLSFHYSEFEKELLLKELNNEINKYKSR